jgi:hypothetical protein
MLSFARHLKQAEPAVQAALEQALRQVPASRFVSPRAKPGFTYFYMQQSYGTLHNSVNLICSRRRPIRHCHCSANRASSFNAADLTWTQPEAWT